MPRYIEEYVLGPEGLELTLPAGSSFLGVQRIASTFYLLVDTVDDASAAREDWIVSVVRRQEYLQSKQRVLGYQVVQNTLMYFVALRKGEEDEPEEFLPPSESADDLQLEDAASPTQETPKLAGGMQVI